MTTPALPFVETSADDVEVMGFGDGYHGTLHYTKALWTREERIAYSKAYIRGVLTRAHEVNQAKRSHQPIPPFHEITEEECHARAA